MIALEERNDVIPTCPHCSMKLEQIWFQELRGIFGKRYLYFCAHCTKVLGVSHRKGFWMG